MPRNKDDSLYTTTDVTCARCTHADPVQRHKHWLSASDDLASHLRLGLPSLVDGKTDDNRIAGILLWCHSTRERYSGMVDERGIPISAWDARQAQQRQYETTYSSTPEPRTAIGRKRVFQSLVGLLTAARSEHAAPWLLMLGEHFNDATIAEEGNWTDFQRCLAEYERSVDEPPRALVRVNTRPVVALATAH
jgi:hypothetical protein